MAMHSDKAVVAVLESMPEYVQAFERAFPQDKKPVTFDNITKAIGAFERKLVTPSRWDRFLKGDENALQPEEKAGFNTFMATGCQSCHLGTYVGGNIYQRLGVAEAWPDKSDPGRYNVTKSEGDRMVFKVPALRNVAMTGPYFHNGKIGSLDEAVTQMARYQLGANLSEAQVRSISAWLKSLTGTLPADLIQAPPLPKSTARTPKPQTT
jgi:cytochrome c peroxidase